MEGIEETTQKLLFLSLNAKAGCRSQKARPAAQPGEACCKNRVSTALSLSPSFPFMSASFKLQVFTSEDATYVLDFFICWLGCVTAMYAQNINYL